MTHTLGFRFDDPDHDAYWEGAALVFGEAVGRYGDDVAWCLLRQLAVAWHERSILPITAAGLFTGDMVPSQEAVARLLFGRDEGP